VAFFDEGRSLASRGDDGLIKVWDVATTRERLSLGGPASRLRCMALSPDGRLLAAGIRDARPPGSEKHSPVVRVWKLDGGGEAAISRHAADVVALEFSPDGKRLASTTRQGVVKLWDTTTFAEVGAYAGRDDTVDLVAFAADGKTLAAGAATGLVSLWDVASGRTEATLTHFGGMNMMQFSPDGTLLATAGSKVGLGTEDGGEPVADLRLHKVPSGDLFAVLPVAGGRVTRLAFAPDSKTVAGAAETPALVLWDIGAARPRAEIAWPSDPARFLAFSPDGRLIAAGCADGVLRVWDASTGTHRADLRGHTDAIERIAFAPDGRTIASASRDATVKLWDVPQAQAPPPER
jgi:WD40 repeat protein